MGKRVQVLLDDEERERFRHHAAREGLSLSAWLRDAGRERLAAAAAGARLESVEQLQRFFAACDAREKGQEPDWEQHQAVIDASKTERQGAS